ncbi:MAG: 3-isopropylmalate dehydratase large subunit, partial [Anaerolinea sp.]|nr:3-isopropylmalate dehydratase large subunit [Anaerolinea sp.]
NRMTICNMSIEGGARAGMIAPDDTTFEYIKGRPYAPQGEAWEKAVSDWRTLPTDEGARYDASIVLDANVLEPMITYGTNPGMGMPISGRIPDPAQISDLSQRDGLIKALKYMDLQPGEPILGHKIDVVFLGSCTNSRISDLRLGASLIKGRKVAPGVRMLVVPGSQQVKRQAESEGLHEIFREAGAEWREAGCSMCIAMNGDQLEPGQYAVSTSNRNFEGRQGKGGRTFLASPYTAVASAVKGVVADAREMAEVQFA